MQKCEYCGFVTKYKSDTCPNCGATKFKSIDSFAGFEQSKSVTTKLKNIPKVRNKVKKLSVLLTLSELLLLVLSIALSVFLLILIFQFFFENRSGDDYSLVVYLGINCLALIILIVNSIIHGFKNKDIKFDYTLLVIVSISIISTYLYNVIFNPYHEKYISYRGAIGMIGGYMVLESLYRIIAYKAGIGLKNYIDAKQEDKKYKSLLKNGILIKNIPYTLVEIYPNKYKIKLNWKSKEGINLELLSKQIVNKKDNDDNADLLIDKSDFGNYYIDYEIT